MGRVSERLVVVGLGVGFEGGLALAAWGLGWAVGRSPWDGFRWDGHAAAWGTAAAGPLLGLLAVGLRWPIGPLGRIKAFLDEVVAPLFAPCTVLDLALVAMAAGVGEEALFRGLVQGALAPRVGAWGALAAASVLFGLFHPITPAYAVIAAVIGAYLGLLWMATGNLLAPIVAHALYDFLALLALRRGGPVSAPGPDGGPG